MTWIANSEGDWHYIVKHVEKGKELGCGMFFADEVKANMFSGEDPPYFKVFDPPMPICQGCKDYRTLRELAD